MEEYKAQKVLVAMKIPYGTVEYRFEVKFEMKSAKNKAKLANYNKDNNVHSVDRKTLALSTDSPTDSQLYRCAGASTKL